MRLMNLRFSLITEGAGSPKRWEVVQGSIVFHSAANWLSTLGSCLADAGLAIPVLTPFCAHAKPDRA